MQAAEMLRGTRAYVYHLVLLMSLSVDYAHPFPLQLLPSIPGYIPVYIRHGDQPLEEINPALAEAFHEGSSLPKKNLANVEGPAAISLEEDEESKIHVEAVHVRQVDNDVPTKDEKMKPADEEPTETSKNKTVSQPVVKVLPLTEEEEKALKDLRVEIEEETENSYGGPHSSPNPIELSSDKPQRRKNVRTFRPVVKVDQIIIDESVKPDLRLSEDARHSSMDEDASASILTDEILPVKEQRLPNVLSNVRKLALTPKMALQLEKERIENQSLEEKSK
ncbi:uncharacterized protein LOC128895561 isoform X2 [Hylaeus anthracinus]|uniref:uncharacterized protein LOC128895561 isoform X2 n=1 Tax=Hylaeus anthracinus TaxID=313031 RepID=UPI0023B9592D|nr:uncharacterized protein LOC128895561 isoform X2 [Hylaeus anthracinus]